MSNAIRYDALLVRDLARELDSVLSGARLDAVYLDRETLRVTLRTRAARRQASPPPSLLWQLHPEAGHLTAPPVDGGAGRVQLASPTIIRHVHAPPDERILIFDLETHDTTPGTARRIIIELVTNQWNGIAVGADDRTTAVLRERPARDLRAGTVYRPPDRSTRAGASEMIPAREWHRVLGAVAPGERLGALLRFAANTSPLNAAFIIGDADVTSEPAALDRAHERYRQLIWEAAPAPTLLLLDGRWQPYSRSEPGRGEPAASLLDAFARAAERSAAAPAESAAVDRALAAISQRIDAIERRARRLRAEQHGAGVEAAQLRREADLLLAQLHRVPRGAAQVELDDFSGGVLAAELDPTLSASENATRRYDLARKRDRAATRIPALIAAGETERARLDRLVEKIRAGGADGEELARIQPPKRVAGRDAVAPALPYREYRTSGGLEVRVGRGSRANDELTFRHSTPNDIWLHARDVAGAHVILRWDRTDENPPGHAIAEAAVLAALFSRARTSGTVAVDWTRRKYVRKPRKSAPGLVIPERVKTVFVEPDAGAEHRMRAEP